MCLYYAYLLHFKCVSIPAHRAVLWKLMDNSIVWVHSSRLTLLKIMVMSLFTILVELVEGKFISFHFSIQNYHNNLRAKYFLMYLELQFWSEYD